MQHHTDITPGPLPPPRSADEPSYFDISDIDMFFACGSLQDIRTTVAAHAARLRLGPEDVDRLVLIASELATNAIRHGGGKGWLRMWHSPTDIYLQIADQGCGIAEADTADTSHTDAGPTHNRGIPLVRTLADDTVIQSSPRGTTATIRFSRTRR